MRTKLLPMILGAALMLVLAAALACGGGDKAAPTPDTAAIQAAVKAGLEESRPAPAPSPVSAAEIQQMVKGAISEIPAPDVPEQLSSAELQQLVEAAVASSAAAAPQPLSASEIQSMVSAVVKASTSEAASKAEIEALIVKAADETAAAAAAAAETAAAEAAAAAAATAIASVPTAVMAPAVAMTSDIKRGGTFILGTPQQINTMDPHAAGPVNNQNAKEGLHATHIRYTLDGVVGPHLFASWDISPDLKTWDFKIQRGVKWHNGRDMDAEDNRFSIQRTIDTDSAYASLYKNLTSVEAVDPSTLRLTSPDATSVLNGAFHKTYIVAKENVSNAEGGSAGADNDFSNPVGVGPFTFVEFIPGEVVRMDRSEDYWQMGEDGTNLPYLDRVEVRTISDPTSLLASLKTGAVHFYWQFPAKNFGALQFDKNANAFITEISTLHFNFAFEHTRTTGDNVFGDVRARRAFALAIDRQALVDVGYGGLGTAMKTGQWIPRTFPLGPKNFPDIEQDTEEAKRLFAEVGITEVVLAFYDTPEWTPISEVIQGNLADAGVKSTIVIDRVADWQCALGGGDCGPDWKWPNMIGVNGAVDPPDPSLHISPQWICPGTWSGGKYCNEEMDRIGSLALQTTDMAERARLYEQWEQIFIEDLPAVSWALTALYDGRHKSLKGVINLFGVPFYEAAWLDN